MAVIFLNHIRASEKKEYSLSLISSVFIATSLDGFIAREDDSLDWLDSANESVPKGEDCGYNSFMNSVDTLVMGRYTFEKVLSFGQWPYENKPVVVLSSRTIKIPDNLKNRVEHSSESPNELHHRLSKKGIHRLYVDGGITIQRFLKAGFINDLTITVIPVIIGKGKPLFGELNNDIQLKHISTKVYDFGFTQSTFQVVRVSKSNIVFFPRPLAHNGRCIIVFHFHSHNKEYKIAEKRQSPFEIIRNALFNSKSKKIVRSGEIFLMSLDKIGNYYFPLWGIYEITGNNYSDAKLIKMNTTSSFIMKRL